MLSQFWNRCLPLGLAVALLGQGCSSVPTAPESTTGAAVSASAAPPKALPKAYEQALTLMRSGDYAAAIPVLEAFSADNPGLAGPHLNLGIAFAHTNQPDKAQAALDKALELNPQNAQAHLQRGILRREQGNFEQALADYNRALKLDPDYALAHRNVGILYDLYLQRPAQALAHYKRYLALSDGDNKTVNGWVIDLERRIGSTTASATP